MRAFVTEKLAPLWRQFACAENVQVLFGVENDSGGPTIPLVLAITYRDHDAMAKGLQHPGCFPADDVG